MGLSDSGLLKARRQNYAPQYHNVVGLSRFFPIYGGHKAPTKGGVEDCQARHSEEASAASDLFGWHSPSPPLPPTPWSRRPPAVGSRPSITVAKPPNLIEVQTVKAVRFRRFGRAAAELETVFGGLELDREGLEHDAATGEKSPKTVTGKLSDAPAARAAPDPPPSQTWVKTQTSICLKPPGKV